MSVTFGSIMEALDQIIDSEIRRPITDFDMTTPDLATIGGSSVAVRVLFTTAECPPRTQITEGTTEHASAVEGAESVSVKTGVMDVA